MINNKFIIDLHDLKAEKINYTREMNKPKKQTKKKKTININDSHVLSFNNPANIDLSLFRYEMGKNYQLTNR